MVGDETDAAPQTSAENPLNPRDGFKGIAKAVFVTVDSSVAFVSHLDSLPHGSNRRPC